MNDYQNFDKLITNELTVLRHGFFMPWFELTDGVYSYGKLSYIGSWKRIALLETAQGDWYIKRKGFFSRILYIEQPEEVIIGTIAPDVLSRKSELRMNDGFEASFTAKSLFSRNYTFVNYPYGDIVDIKKNIWSLKMPFTITIDLHLLKTVPNLPLIALLSLSLALMQQQQRQSY